LKGQIDMGRRHRPYADDVIADRDGPYPAVAVHSNLRVAGPPRVISFVQAAKVLEYRRHLELPVGLPQPKGPSDHTCATTQAGAVYCWGNGTQGEFGGRSQ
jgi:hypothetical protein